MQSQHGAEEEQQQEQQPNNNNNNNNTKRGRSSSSSSSYDEEAKEDCLKNQTHQQDDAVLVAAAPAVASSSSSSPPENNNDAALPLLVQQLQEQHAAKLAALDEQHAAKLAALDEQHAALDEQLAALRAKNAAKDEQLAAKERKYSIKALLEIHVGIPQLETNTAVEEEEEECKEISSTPAATAAIDDEEAAAAAAATSNSSNHHAAEADILEMSKRVADNYFGQFQVNFKDQNGIDLLLSCIAIRMGSHKWMDKEAKLGHLNQKCVTLHMDDLLHDVLSCLHLLGSPTTLVGEARSIFSMRPDMMVVCWKTRIILVIKVKDPGANGANVVANDRFAAGKAYDYAMSLQQMMGTNHHPFVCLSTYDFLRIGSLQEHCSHEIMQETAERLKNGPIGTTNPSSLSEPGKPAHIPEKKGNLTDAVIPGDDDNESVATGAADESEEAASTKNRRIYFSEIFDRKNIFQALYFAIACGIVAVEKAEKYRNQDLVPKEGELIDRHVVACVGTTSSSFHWETLKCKATYKLKNKDNWRSSNNMKVYLHCVLGQGCSGKVYLGSSSRGEMFAVKLYLFDSPSFRNYEANEEEIQKEWAMETRDDEAQTWQTMYPGCHVVKGELYGVPSLIMPYVNTAIPMNRREDLLAPIEDELTRLSKIGMISDHLCWRHVGLLRMDNDDDDNGDTEKVVLLVDLESTTTTTTTDDVNTAVQSAMAELERCAPVEPVVYPKEIIHP